MGCSCVVLQAQIACQWRKYGHLPAWKVARSDEFFAQIGERIGARRPGEVSKNSGYAEQVPRFRANEYAGLASGHLWRHLVPRLRELAPRLLWRDIVTHLRLPMLTARGGPPYGLLQKLTYASVLFVALPLMILTGLTMSPAVTAAYPGLLDLFGGSQSARTIHFFVFAALVLFLIVHVVMVALTGFRRQMRAMTFGD